MFLVHKTLFFTSNITLNMIKRRSRLNWVLCIIFFALGYITNSVISNFSTVTSLMRTVVYFVGLLVIFVVIVIGILLVLSFVRRKQTVFVF